MQCQITFTCFSNLVIFWCFLKEVDGIWFHYKIKGKTCLLELRSTVPQTCFSFEVICLWLCCVHMWSRHKAFLKPQCWLFFQTWLKRDSLITNWDEYLLSWEEMGTEYKCWEKSSKLSIKFLNLPLLCAFHIWKIWYNTFLRPLLFQELHFRTFVVKYTTVPELVQTWYLSNLLHKSGG